MNKLNKIISIALISSLALTSVGCGNRSIESDLEGLSTSTKGKYTLTVKLTSNGNSRYLKFDGEGTSMVSPYSEKLDISYKDGDGDYTSITDLYRYNSDTYVNINGLLSKVAETAELEDYTYQIEDLSKSYVLVNDEIAAKAFNAYLENNPNLLNVVKPRVITERETAYGIKDNESLRTQGNMTVDKSELDRLSDMTTFIPNNERECMIDAYNFLYSSLGSYEVNEDSKFGVKAASLNGNDALSYIEFLKEEADNEAIVTDLFGGLLNSEFVGYVLEKHGSTLNKSFGTFLDSVLSTGNSENAVVEFKSATSGFGKKLHNKVYINISSDGVNGIEVLYDLMPNIDVERMTVPVDVYNLYNIYENMAVKYLEK